ncbi:MAG TPA: LON peptidase substrate-binding domain-containing protein, partial [Pyrinomonadaceae bacterium]
MAQEQEKNSNPQPSETKTAEVKQSESQPMELAVLPLQSTTLFPETVVPLSVGRPRSVAALEAALATPEKLIACITVRPESSGGQDAKSKDLYSVGTLVMIKRMERVDDVLHIVAQGTDRLKVLEWKQEDPFVRAVVQLQPQPSIVDAEEVEATKRNVQAMVQQALALLPGVPPEVRVAVLGSVEPVRLAYFLASILNLGVEQEQKMLEANTADELLRLAHGYLARELEIIQLRSKIASEAQTEMDKAQRDYVLRQQMRAI